MKNSFYETTKSLYGKIVKVGDGKYEGKYNLVYIMKACLELMELDNSSQSNLKQIQSVMDEWAGDESLFHYQVVSLKKTADLGEDELVHEADDEGANVFIPLFTPCSDKHYFMVAQSLPELLEYDLMNLLVSVESYTLYLIKHAVVDMIKENESNGRDFWMYCCKKENSQQADDASKSAGGSAEACAAGNDQQGTNGGLACFLACAHELENGDRDRKEAADKFDFLFTQMNKSAMVDFFLSRKQNG